MIKKWYEPKITEIEVKQGVDDLRAFILSDEYQEVLNFLGTRRTYLLVYSFDDVCGMHDVLFLSENGFVGPGVSTSVPGKNPLLDLNEIVEGFMSGYYDSAIPKDASKIRHPSELIPWIKKSIQRIRDEEARTKISYCTLVALIPRKKAEWFFLQGRE